MIDNDDNEGPMIKKSFTCKGCKWLNNIYDDNSKLFNKNSCLHPEVISQYKTDSEFIYKIFMGTLNENLETPSFCPYLLKKLRLEKLKTIDDE